MARVWDAGTGNLIHTLRGHGNSVLCVAYSPDGSRIVTGSTDGYAIIWDAATGSLLRKLPALGGFVCTASFSPDGTRIVTASGDASRVWDAGTGAGLLTIKGHSGQVVSASFSLDSTRIVAGVEDGAARVWEASTGAPLLTLKGHTGHIFSATFSPDGKQIVTARAGGSATVSDVATGADIVTFHGHSDHVIWASFSPDVKQIVTASNDGTAKVWDAQTGAEVLTLRGHTKAVVDAKFAPDGSRIVTAGDDGTAKIWDAVTGAEVLSLRGSRQDLYTASFSPDGSRVAVVAVVDGSGTVTVWDAGPYYRSSASTPPGTAVEAAGPTVVAPKVGESPIPKGEPAELPEVEPKVAGPPYLGFNESFEEPACEAEQVVTSIPGWTGSADNGLFFGVTRETSRLPEILDGSQAAYVNNFPSGEGEPTNHSIAQQRNEVVQATTTYKVSAYFGWRNDNQESTGGLELWAGGKALEGEIVGGTKLVSSSIALTQGQFVLGTVSYVSSPSDSHLGKRLSIRLTGTPKANAFAQINFDQVTLTTTKSKSPATKP